MRVPLGHLCTKYVFYSGLADEGMKVMDEKNVIVTDLGHVC